MCGEFVQNLVSALIGGCLATFGQWVHYKIVTAKDRSRDEGRRKLLKQMLDNPDHDWRKLETLSRVIGASTDETTRLLIDIGARGSEKDDGLWGYVAKHRLP